MLDENNDHLSVVIIATFKHRLKDTCNSNARDKQPHTINPHVHCKQVNCWTAMTIQQSLHLIIIFYLIKNVCLYRSYIFHSGFCWLSQLVISCNLFLKCMCHIKWQKETLTCCSGVWGVSCSHHLEACVRGCVSLATQPYECQKNWTGSSSSYPFCPEGLGQTNLEEEEEVKSQRCSLGLDSLIPTKSDLLKWSQLNLA